MLPTLNRLRSPKRCSFCKDIVSSSEQSHNQNICVAVIFVPKI
nr:MAG TPA: YyzF-like protein [Caudoviricetes sp.]